MRGHPASVLCLVLAASATFAAEPPQRPDPVRNVQLPAKPKIMRIAPVAPAEPASIAVPRGSYLETCQNVRVDGDSLNASCSFQSRLRDSSISVSRCEGGDISNRYGNLTCVTSVRAHWGGRVLPPGSWLGSCSGYVDGTTLVAGCLTGEGGSSFLGVETSREGIRSTRLDLSRCPDGADIANLRGDLTCIR